MDEREPGGRRKGSIANELSNIEWEYVPESDAVVLFEPMGSFFEDFPWEGGRKPHPSARPARSEDGEGSEGLRRLVESEDG